jgi:D-galactose 1-dehydrogenase
MDVVLTVAIVGLGKIANDQHCPVIEASDAFRIGAVVSRRRLTVAGASSFPTLSDMLAADLAIDAVALCTPPLAHFSDAMSALHAGKHVLLEKPPTLTLSQLAELERAAASADVTLFATWHSRFNAGVEQLAERLREKTVAALAIVWKEDVRRWHPGQAWIWQPGGFGVFDPGINALSILTAVLPEGLSLRDAELDVPANAAMPIAARLRFGMGAGPAALTADFDWRQTGPQTWDIEIRTTDGTSYQLRNGGRTLLVDGKTVVDEPSREYEAIYERFATLIAARDSDVDATPLRLVADVFMIGRRNTVEAFHEDHEGA